MNYFNIEKYIINIQNNKNQCIKDKLGNDINIGDEIFVKDQSNFHRNSICGKVTKCFIHKNIPYIRVNRQCSKYEEYKNEFQNKSCNDEQVSILCLKKMDNNIFNNIDLSD